MDAVDLESSVPDWLLEHPELWPLFQELGLECHCGGKSLRTACHEQGVSPEWTLSRVRAVIQSADAP